ncbi:neuromedin-U receptor 1 [Amblyraja radiata]|uniref:neuromedin-U receptor 1 n=1 Tax=Amblyraja radiata TaxID=386614 RepID=UPI001403926D|nr:neuromedin-U receptor 1 [Amblyraja radiata]
MDLGLSEGLPDGCGEVASPDHLTQDLQWTFCNSTSPQQNLSANGSDHGDHWTRGDYLLHHLGPRTWSFFTPACGIYLGIFVVGFIGNALTCFVIAKHKVMRTPTNYYLFSLAVSDLMVLAIGMPLEVYEMWRNYPFLFGQAGCYFKTFLFETVCFASVLNVTALSVERYIAVLHPLKAKYIVTRTHARRVIIALWALSCILAVPNTSLHGIHYLKTRSGELMLESALCVLLRPLWLYNLVIQTTTLVFYLLPMVTLSALHLLIGLQLRREGAFSQSELESGAGSYQIARKHEEKLKNRQITKMLFVLVIVFGVCWAPFHTDRLLWVQIAYWNGQMLTLYQCVHVVSGVFFYLSSAVNPVLYNLLSTRFREMFKEVMCGRQSPRYKPACCSASTTRATAQSTALEYTSCNGIPMLHIDD